MPRTVGDGRSAPSGCSTSRKHPPTPKPPSPVVGDASASGQTTRPAISVNRVAAITVPAPGKQDEPHPTQRPQIHHPAPPLIKPRMHLRLHRRGFRIKLHPVRLHSHDRPHVRRQQTMWHLRQHRIRQILHHQGHPVRLRPTSRQPVRFDRKCTSPKPSRSYLTSHRLPIAPTTSSSLPWISVHGRSRSTLTTRTACSSSSNL